MADETPQNEGNVNEAPEDAPEAAAEDAARALEAVEAEAAHELPPADASAPATVAPAATGPATEEDGARPNRRKENRTPISRWSIQRHSLALCYPPDNLGDCSRRRGTALLPLEQLMPHQCPRLLAALSRTNWRKQDCQSDSLQTQSETYVPASFCRHRMKSLCWIGSSSAAPVELYR